MNSEFIAEGIETETELQRVIDLGIDYGEGFLLQSQVIQFLQLPKPRNNGIDFFELKSKSRSVTIDISYKIIVWN